MEALPHFSAQALASITLAMPGTGTSSTARRRVAERGLPRGSRAHIEQVLALKGQAAEGRQWAHDLLNQHVCAFRQLVQCACGVGVA